MKESENSQIEKMLIFAAEAVKCGMDEKAFDVINSVRMRLEAKLYKQGKIGITMDEEEIPHQVKPGKGVYSEPLNPK